VNTIYEIMSCRWTKKNDWIKFKGNTETDLQFYGTYYIGFSRSCFQCPFSNQGLSNEKCNFEVFFTGKSPRFLLLRKETEIIEKV